MSWVGDQWCDAKHNTASCGWDHGDCCEQTCPPGYGDCGVYAGFDCKDPDVLATPTTTTTTSTPTTTTTTTSTTATTTTTRAPPARSVVDASYFSVLTSLDILQDDGWVATGTYDADKYQYRASLGGVSIRQRKDKPWETITISKVFSFEETYQSFVVQVSGCWWCFVVALGTRRGGSCVVASLSHRAAWFVRVCVSACKCMRRIAVCRANDRRRRYGKAGSQTRHVSSVRRSERVVGGRGLLGEEEEHCCFFVLWRFGVERCCWVGRGWVGCGCGASARESSCAPHYCGLAN